MKRISFRIGLLLAPLWLSLPSPPLDAAAAGPETVLLTFHPKRGAEQALAAAIAQHWTVARQLGLVLDAPHLTLRGADAGGAYFVEVLTWRDAAVPDNAPPAIVEIWDRMNGLVESRGGRPGLDFRAMTVIPPAR